MENIALTIYLIIADNWILTLFVKISCNLTKKDVQYLVSCKKCTLLSFFWSLRYDIY